MATSLLMDNFELSGSVTEDGFRILQFTWNTDKLFLSKKYHQKENIIKYGHSPNFFKIIEEEILTIFPNIIAINTQNELNRGSYFHSDFLPSIMCKLKYKLLIRDKHISDIGTLRSSIYIQQSDNDTIPLELNKKLLQNDNKYDNNQYFALTLYLQTYYGKVAFINMYNFANIIDHPNNYQEKISIIDVLEDKFINNKNLDYVVMAGDFIDIINNYSEGELEIDENKMFNHGKILYKSISNNLHDMTCESYIKINKEPTGYQSNCNIGLMGIYRIKCENNIIFDTNKFPKYDLINDSLAEKLNIVLSNHTIFILTQNKIYVYVDNNINHNDKSFLINYSKPAGYWLYQKNIKYNTFFQLANIEGNIESIIGGYEHFIFLTDDKKIYGLGNNKYGQLGLKTSIVVYDFHELMQNVRIVSCGLYHTIISTNNGLYACGSNIYGQIGIKNKYLTNVKSFERIDTDKEIIRIACGDYHTLFLTDENELYGCGSNKYYQLGLDNECRDVKYPTILDFENVINMWCGDNYSVIYNQEGLFRLGPANDMIPLEDIITVSCGSDHILVLTKDGLYGFKNTENINIIKIEIPYVIWITSQSNISIIQTNTICLRIYCFKDLLENKEANYIWDMI